MNSISNNYLPFKLIFVMILLIGLAFNGSGQNENKFLRKGNSKYEQKNFKDAEIEYRKALDKNPASDKALFNLGTALYNQEKAGEEAIKSFESLTSRNLTPDIASSSLHNLGNSYTGAQQYDKAIEAYKKALRLNPTDQDTKYNLSYAQKMLKQQQQQQQNQQNKDQQDKKDNKNQNQQQQQQNQDQQQQQQQQQSNQNQQQGNQQQAKQLSKEDAQRMLQALKDNEKKTIQKINKIKVQKSKPIKSDKDW